MAVKHWFFDTGSRKTDKSLAYIRSFVVSKVIEVISVMIWKVTLCR